MNGFISYAHDDRRMFDEFRDYLTAVERAFHLTLWADTSLLAGHHWNTEIEQAIARAEVFVLLISPAFIASDFIYTQEIPAIRQRARTTDAPVFPVVLRRCFWKLVTDELQGVPTANGSLKPIEDWRPRGNGYHCAGEQIIAAIQHQTGRKPNLVGWSTP